MPVMLFVSLLGFGWGNKVARTCDGIFLATQSRLDPHTLKNATQSITVPKWITSAALRLKGTMLHGCYILFKHRALTGVCTYILRFLLRVTQGCQGSAWSWWTWILNCSAGFRFWAYNNRNLSQNTALLITDSHMMLPSRKVVKHHELFAMKQGGPNLRLRKKLYLLSSSLPSHFPWFLL